MSNSSYFSSMEECQVIFHWNILPLYGAQFTIIQTQQQNLQLWNLYLLLKMQQNQNPQVLLGVDWPDLSDLPSQMRYVYILLRSQLNQPSIKPYAHIIKDENTTLKAFIDEYRKSTSYSVPNAKHYYFTLYGGLHLNSKLTVKELQINLARDKIDGLILYLQSSPQQMEYEHQCCVTDYFSKEKQFGTNQYYATVNLTLEGNPTEILNVYCKFTDERQTFIKLLLKQIKLDFGLVLQFNKNDIIQIRNSYTVVKFIEKERLNKHNISKTTLIVVELANPKKHVLKRKNKKNYNSYIVIYKQNQIQPIRLKFDEISDKFFEDLYKEKLQLGDSKYREDAIYCLKVMDAIVRPNEKMSSIEHYFRNQNSNIVAKVVNQKMIFYKIISNFVDKYGEFTLDELTIPQNQQNERLNCEEIVRKRAERSPNQYFKNIKNLQPIVIYTSNLKYQQKLSKKLQVIYVSLNKYIRETSILSLDQQTYQHQWRIKYAGTLLKHLKKTKKVQGRTTWRGVSYNPCLTNEDKGRIFTFKPFTSTSIFQVTAVSFAKKQLKQEFYHLFAFTIKNGRELIDYSMYLEGEVLLEPFTEFQLTKITEQTLQGKPFKIYHLTEYETSKQLPGVRANFLVWIDDKTKQGKLVFDRIRLPSQSTIFVQISSTAELRKWIEQHYELFYDETANLIFITNMRRKEGDKQNEVAGIDGVKLIREVDETIPVLFYIGNIEATSNKLADSQIDLQNIEVCNEMEVLEQYLERHLGSFEQ